MLGSPCVWFALTVFAILTFLAIVAFYLHGHRSISFLRLCSGLRLSSSR